jgi:hypothetical protein
MGTLLLRSGGDGGRLGSQRAHCVVASDLEEAIDVSQALLSHEQGGVDPEYPHLRPPAVAANDAVDRVLAEVGHRRHALGQPAAVPPPGP